jgi:hypothetical protein
MAAESYHSESNQYRVARSTGCASAMSVDSQGHPDDVLDFRTRSPLSYSYGESVFRCGETMLRIAKALRCLPQE